MTTFNLQDMNAYIIQCNDRQYGDSRITLGMDDGVNVAVLTRACHPDSVSLKVERLNGKRVELTE